MSLVRTAVRLATRQALLGRTLVGDEVHDSIIETVDAIAAGAGRMFVVIYTDDGEVADRPHADLMAGNVSFILVIEFAVLAKATDIDNDAVFDSVLTDGRLEIELDRIERQIKVTLTDPTNPWAALWRAFVVKIDSQASKRGASAQKGLRFAARQIEMTVRSLAEPPFGRAASGQWAALLALMEGNEELAPLAPIIRAEIEGDDPQSDMQLRMRHWAPISLDAMGYDPDAGDATVGEPTDVTLRIAERDAPVDDGGLPPVGTEEPDP